MLLFLKYQVIARPDILKMVAYPIYLEIHIPLNVLVLVGIILIMEKPNIISVGFEGPHRSGKGTQIELLSRTLEEKGIPFLVIRGDGSRPNEGIHLGDPVSEWWSFALPELKKENPNLEDWNKSSYHLARELLVFRD